MELLLDIAHQSPSSMGLEGWRFIAFDNQKVDCQLKADLRAISWGAQPQLDTASHFIFLVAERNARYDSPSVRECFIRRGLTDERDIQARIDLYKDFQTRDMKMADDERTLFDWTAKQTYIAMGNIMTSAALLGLDTCPIEGFNQEEANRILTEAGIIDQTKEGLASMISVGYRLRSPKHQKTRKPREEVVSWLTD
jgi:nitroreductase